MERLPAVLYRLPRSQPLPRQAFRIRNFSRGMASTTKTAPAPAANRIHILGAGNLGQYLARGLVRQNPALPVTMLFHRAGLLADWKKAGEAIKCTVGGKVDETRGIDVELIDGTEGEGARIEHLIVACKTYAAVPALRLVQTRLDERSTIVFLQNGMGTTDEVTREVFPDARTRPSYWVGICNLGVASTKPFSIVPTPGGLITLGPIVTDADSKSAVATTTTTPPETFLTKQLTQVSEPPSVVVPPHTLRKAQLLKLVGNAMINPLTVILRCENGKLLDHTPVTQLMDQLVKEAGPVIRKLAGPYVNDEVEGDPEPLSDEHLMQTVVGLIHTTRGNTSSMLQDVRNGKQTEIDYINGFIVAEGERMGRRCEKHAILVEMVKNGERIVPSGIKSRFRGE